MGKKAVLFDFDGTIVDSMSELAEVASGLISTYYGLSKGFAEKIYIETSGLPFCEQMEIMFPACSQNKEIIDTFEDTKEKEFWNYKVFPDTKEIFQYLRMRGYIVAVSSNNFTEVIGRYLDQFGIERDEVLGFVEEKNFFKGKPHFDYISSKYGISYDDITLVGDSIKDGEKAKANNINFIGRIGTNSKERFFSVFGKINTIDELTELKNFF